MTTSKPTKAQTEFLKRLKTTGPADVHILADMASPRTMNTCVANGWATVDASIPGSPKLVITDAGEVSLLASAIRAMPKDERDELKHRWVYGPVADLDDNMRFACIDVFGS